MTGLVNVTISGLIYRRRRDKRVKGMKYKIITVVVVSLVLVAASCPLSFAATNPAPVATSVMTEPVPSFTAGSEYDTYEAYMIYYKNGYYGMFAYTILVPHGHPLTFHVWTNWQWRIESDVNYKASYVSYNVLTGEVAGIKSEVEGNNFNMILAGQWPNNGGNCTDAFFILPDEITLNVQNTQFFSYDSFINWAPVVPSIHSYSSYLSEPISDPYNRYIVLAGEDEQYIFLLSFSLSDLTMFNSQSVNQGVDEIDLIYNHVFIPTLKLDENQLKLEIDVNPQIFYILNNTDNHLYTYNLMLGKYRLVDGQYISSTLYNGTISSNTTSLAFDFGTVSDFDSIKTYGVEYIDMLTSQWHFNFLHCSWGHDPEFETWKQNVLYYLEQIYNLMNTPEDETVTVADDTSAMNEMESAKDDLVVTDASGQAVDPAQAAEDNFSMAAEQIGELAEPVSTVNGLMSSLIFDKPKLVLPIIVALALGLLVTILGKNKSD